ncbi:MAG: Stealth CR1 domain-containing protein [Victivallaceae bacterium]|nr:Stealth CR1 domain-containing protein [Victivallaceae bacterium]
MTGNARQKAEIDFVVTWVDGNDPAWRACRDRYRPESERIDNLSDVRYRDNGLLKYWFRGVEKFAPWVRKVHFVTWGHLPPWLDVEHPKINIVRHEDFIPAEYLPTFSSHAIELNLHRIADLAEKFVYFNDDTLLTSSVVPTDFFRNGLPCDCAIMKPVTMIDNGIRAEINDMYVINRRFDKREVLQKHWKKFFAPCCGLKALSTLFMLPYRGIPGFWVRHLPCAYLKSSFETLWREEPAVLEKSCRHKFRHENDVNHWLIEYWQYASGTFAPISPRIGKAFEGAADMKKMEAAVASGKYRMICCNDAENVADFKDVIARFAALLPDVSGYEKTPERNPRAEGGTSL